MATIRTPHTDTNIHRKVMRNAMDILEWTQVPLLKRLGWENEGSRFKFENWPPGNAKKIEWPEDTLSGTSTTLASAINSTTATSITLTDGTLVHAGHVLVIDSEYFNVTDRTGNVVTVTRGFAGTSAATHTNSTAVYIRTIAKTTGANYAIGHTTTVSVPFNYTQILEQSVQVNKDQEVATDYGVTDTMAYHVGKLIGGTPEVGQKGRAGILPQMLQRIAYYGKRQAPSDSVAGAAGGFTTFITTNSYGGTATALTRSTVHQAIRQIYTNGGEPDLLVCSPWGAELITSLYEDMIRTERSEERGGSVIKYIDTPVREGVELLVDYMCPNTDMWLLDSMRTGWVTVRPFKATQMPSLGDYEVISVLGEFSFVVEQETTHAKISHPADPNG